MTGNEEGRSENVSAIMAENQDACSFQTEKERCTYRCVNKCSVAAASDNDLNQEVSFSNLQNTEGTH